MADEKSKAGTSTPPTSGTPSEAPGAGNPTGGRSPAAAQRATPAGRRKADEKIAEPTGQPGELHPLQDEDARREVLARAAGGQTATGMERERMLTEDAGNDPDELIPTGEDRGSTVPIAEPPEDGEGGDPERLAIMLTNGSLKPGRVATPSGPMPASAFADGAARLKAQQDAINEPYPRSGDMNELTDEQLARMSGAEIRAVAIDRGYAIMPGGKRASVAAFRKAQEEDDRINEADEK